jgi:hypothetical protein
VHALPSSHETPVRGESEQLAVPLQLRVIHVVLVHVTVAPAHVPAPHTSP